MIEGPRAATKNELAAVVAMTNDVFYPDGSIDMGASFPMLFREENLPHVRIVLDEGTPVAHVGFTIRDLSLGSAKIRVACFGAVSTVSRHRGQGLATLLIEDALRAALGEGAVAILVSGERGLYKRMGCVNAGLYSVVTFKKGSTVPSPHCSAREWSETDIPEMMALHQREAVRFVRDPAEMRVLLDSRVLFCRPSRTWVVRDAERLLAYVSVGEPFDRTETGGLHAREMAGSRAAVLSALPAVAEAGRVDTIEIDATSDDLELRALAQTLSWPMTPAGFHGTVKIVETKSFFEALEAHFAERLSASERRDFHVVCGSPDTAFIFAKERFAVETDGELASLVFGSVEEKAPRVGGKLGEILERVFPLPLPCYGLNYI